MINNKIITDFTLHNNNDQSVIFKEATGNPQCGYEGPTTMYTWRVDGLAYEMKVPKLEGLYVFPDETGFLFIEEEKRSDNLLLLDVYGKEKARLSIPLYLVFGTSAANYAEYPSGFIGVTAPWENQKTKEKGKFAVG